MEQETQQTASPMDFDAVAEKIRLQCGMEELVCKTPRHYERVIRGRTYQFMRRPGTERTSLLYKLTALSELLGHGLQEMQSAIPKELQGVSTAEMSMEDAKRVDGAMGYALVSAIQRLSDPQYEQLVRTLIGWAQVKDLDTGEFKSLEKESAFDAAFDDDLFAQFPVALTTLEVNFGNFIKSLQDVFR